MVSVYHEDPTSDIIPCATAGCDEPATLIGTLYDHDMVYEGVTYCDFCAGYLYQQFVIAGPAVPRPGR